MLWFFCDCRTLNPPQLNSDRVANQNQQHGINVGEFLKRFFTSAIHFSEIILEALWFHSWAAISNSFGFGEPNSVVAFSAFKPWHEQLCMFSMEQQCHFWGFVKLTKPLLLFLSSQAYLTLIITILWNNSGQKWTGELAIPISRFEHSII